MKYKRLVLIAPAWREELDPKTDTLYLRAEFSARGYCETIMTPIPGTDPVQYEYSCLPVTCEGDCELTYSTLPDGTIVAFCSCPPTEGSKAMSNAASRSPRKPATKKKAAKGKGKGKPKSTR